MTPKTILGGLWHLFVAVAAVWVGFHVRTLILAATTDPVDRWVVSGLVILWAIGSGLDSLTKAMEAKA